MALGGGVSGGEGAAEVLLLSGFLNIDELHVAEPEIPDVGREKERDRGWDGGGKCDSDFSGKICVPQRAQETFWCEPGIMDCSDEAFVSNRRFVDDIGSIVSWPV